MTPPTTAIVTGVTGQMGSYIAEFLLAKGFKVVGTVRRLSVKNHRNIGCVDRGKSGVGSHDVAKNGSLRDARKLVPRLFDRARQPRGRLGVVVFGERGEFAPSARRGSDEHRLSHVETAKPRPHRKPHDPYVREKFVDVGKPHDSNISVKL